jgi:hypothetical protein
MPCLPRIRRQNGAASAVLLIGLDDDQRFSPDRGSSKKIITGYQTNTPRNPQ